MESKAVSIALPANSSMATIGVSVSNSEELNTLLNEGFIEKERNLINPEGPDCYLYIVLEKP